MYRGREIRLERDSFFGGWGPLRDGAVPSGGSLFSGEKKKHFHRGTGATSERGLKQWWRQSTRDVYFFDGSCVAHLAAAKRIIGDVTRAVIADMAAKGAVLWDRCVACGYKVWKPTARRALCALSRFRSQAHRPQPPYLCPVSRPHRDETSLAHKLFW